MDDNDKLTSKTLQSVFDDLCGNPKLKATTIAFFACKAKRGQCEAMEQWMDEKPFNRKIAEKCMAIFPRMDSEINRAIAQQNAFH